MGELEIGIWRFCRIGGYASVDQTQMKHDPGRKETIWHKGDEEVAIDSPCDEKAGLTFCASVNAAGEPGPCWLIARGLRDGCERRFRENFSDWIEKRMLFVRHQQNSWRGIEVTKQILDDFAAWTHVSEDDSIVLIWDCFSAQRNAGVREYAKSLGIIVLFIPAGMTGICQPLDLRLFGELKNRAGSIHVASGVCLARNLPAGLLASADEGKHSGGMARADA
jgi:hypothetical protein